MPSIPTFSKCLGRFGGQWKTFNCFPKINYQLLIRPRYNDMHQIRHPPACARAEICTFLHTRVGGGGGGGGRGHKQKDSHCVDCLWKLGHLVTSLGIGQTFHNFVHIFGPKWQNSYKISHSCLLALERMIESIKIMFFIAKLAYS